MPPHFMARGWPLALSVALAACLCPVQAQTPPTPADHKHSEPAGAPDKPEVTHETWNRANKSVGQFSRGHIDLLRWEQRKTTPSAPVPGEPNHVGAPLDMDQAVHRALQGQPQWLRRADLSAAEQSQLNAQLQARVLLVRRVWIEAVAAQQSVHYSRQILEAAEAGAELADRMARIGNWSQARRMQEELLLWDARTRLQTAELQALQSAMGLWQLTGDHAPGTAALQTPDKANAQALNQTLPALPNWPGLPEAALPAWAALAQQALAAHPQWPMAQAEAKRLMDGQSPASLAQVRQAMTAAQEGAHPNLATAGQIRPALLPAHTPWSHSAEKALQAQADADALQRQIRADVRMAHAAYESARTQAAHQQNQVLRLHTALQQESLLRYNGMLQSTWDLLASARRRIQSVDAAHQAQRQAWLAWADLQAVLNGLPYSASLSNTSSTPSTPSAGH